MTDFDVRLESDRILHLIWVPGIRIEGANARAAINAVNDLAAGDRYPLLVEMTEVAFLDREAREVFAAPGAGSRIALLGSGPVERMLVSYQLATVEVPVPTRFFTSKAEALAWLREVPRR